MNQIVRQDLQGRKSGDEAGWQAT